MLLSLATLGLGGLGVTLLKGTSSCKLKLSSSEIADYITQLNQLQ